MKIFLLTIVLAGSIAGNVHGGPLKPVLTEEFLGYIKQTTNPHQFGLASDGRFYPYSTPRGRRIGYDEPVKNKGLYRKGITRTEADRLFKQRVEAALSDLKRLMARTHPDQPFSRLPPRSQEMLLDFAFSEGAKNIPSPFLEAVLAEDWDRLFAGFHYIRWVEKGWPDTLKNKAFADRWLPRESRLRPAATVWLDPAGLD